MNTLKFIVLSVALVFAGVANASLVGHWDFDSSFRDLSGNGNDSDYSGMPLLVAGTGLSPEAAVQFDGVDDVLIVQNSPSLNTGAGDFTVTTWVKSTWADGDDKQFILKYGTAGSEFGGKEKDGGINSGNRIVMKLEGSDFRFLIDSELDGGKEVLKIDPALVTTGEWVHVAGVRDSAASLLRLYINGVEVATHDTENTFNIDHDEIMTIGAAAKENGDYLGEIGHWFAGELDDVRFYDEALSAGAIASTIPEPATLALLGLGGLLLRRRRR